jgi:uncharacterized RDD family membrane protein YckC
VTVAELGPIFVPPATPAPAEILPQPAEAALPQRIIYAGFWLRAVAFFIDSLILSFLLLLAHSVSPAPLILIPDPNAPISTSALLSPPFTPAGFVVLIVLMWLYFAIFEASGWQATPGKRMLRLYVTDLKARPVTFLRASVRCFSRWLTFGVGYLLAAIPEKKQGLHDLIAGCLVLRRPPPETFHRTAS